MPLQSEAELLMMSIVGYDDVPPAPDASITQEFHPQDGSPIAGFLTATIWAGTVSGVHTVVRQPCTPVYEQATGKVNPGYGSLEVV